MNFKIISCSQIDKDKWNQRILLQGSDIYNEYEYLQIVCNRNWQGIVWGDYEKVLPFYQKKKWGLFPYICMPPFCQKFDTSTLTQAELSEVIKYFKRNNIIVDYRVSDNKDLKHFIEKTNFKLDKRGRNYEEIYSHFSSLLKKNLTKSNEINISNRIDNEKFNQFIQKHSQFNELILARYSTVFWELYRNQLTQYYAEIDNEIIAFLFIAIFDEKAYLLFPFTNEKGKKHQAMSQLIAHIIQDKKINSIDFEGSSIPAIAHFYQQFGGENVPYFSVHKKFWG